MTGRIEYRFLKYIWISLCALMPLQTSFPTALSLAMERSNSSVLIRPGHGVADLQLDDTVPRDEKERIRWVKNWADRDVQIDLNENHTRIDRIIIRSPRFFIDGNRIGVYRSNIVDVKKFYGQGSITNKPKLIYPFYGVEFLYDPVTKKVIEITLFRPERKKPELKKEAIKAIMKQMKMVK